MRNQTLLLKKAGSIVKDSVILENSYHVATMDLDSELISRQSIRFVRRIHESHLVPIANTHS